MENRIRDIIRKCYLEILNREPDKIGFDYYSNLMEENKINESKLIDIMKSSDEYKLLEQKRQFMSKYDMNNNFYGKVWVGQDDNWYSEIFNHVPLLHTNFIQYFKNKKDVKTVLEIGCGTGIYPIRFKELFSDKKYVGIDISESAIHIAKRSSGLDFICGDFLKMDLKEKYDLIFSNSVIDHVYDIDLFLSRIVNLTRKYAYISAYGGFYDTITEHEMKHIEKDGYYMNKISVTKVKEYLLRKGLKIDEFIIRPQVTGHTDIREGTVIEIEKKY